MTLSARWIYYLCAWIPKRNTAVVHTWPSFEDTALALVPGLEKTRLKKIYYLTGDNVPAGPAPAWGPKVVILPKRSLRALWGFLRSRYAFFTHQCYTTWFPHNVVSVNVWHGMPVKRIGWMLPDGQKNHAQYDLATSDFWKPIIQECMRPWGKVLVNGLPRCDRFHALGRVGVRTRLSGIPAEAKLAVWLPTYRQTVLGELRRDGRDFDNMVQMPGFNPEEFEAWLASRNWYCILKPHPAGPQPRFRDQGHLRVMNDAMLAAQGLTLYSLLGGADVLLTDVSSVYVDFLVLNRPVIHAFADRAEYGRSRGFSFPWTDEYLAGPWVGDMDGVRQALDDVAAGRDAYAQRRQRLRALFHAQPDAAATPTLLAQIGLPIRETLP